MKTRIDSLVIILEDIKPDVVILCEHKLHSTEIENINIPGFTLVSHYCRESQFRGGGVMILVSVNIKSAISIEPKCKLNEDNFFESCAVAIHFSDVKVIIGGLYRKPSSTVNHFLEKLSRFINGLIQQGTYIVLGGDINRDVIKVKDKNVIDLSNMLRMYGLFYTIETPTRVTAETETAIDNFLTNVNRNLFQVSCLVTALSDHDGQCFYLKQINNNSSKQKQYTKVVRAFSKGNIEQFIREIKYED